MATSLSPFHRAEKLMYVPSMDSLQSPRRPKTSVAAMVSQFEQRMRPKAKAKEESIMSKELQEDQDQAVTSLSPLQKPAFPRPTSAASSLKDLEIAVLPSITPVQTDSVPDLTKSLPPTPQSAVAVEPEDDRSMVEEIALPDMTSLTICEEETSPDSPESSATSTWHYESSPATSTETKREESCPPTPYLTKDMVLPPLRENPGLRSVLPDSSPASSVSSGLKPDALSLRFPTPSSDGTLEVKSINTSSLNLSPETASLDDFSAYGPFQSWIAPPTPPLSPETNDKDEIINNVRFHPYGLNNLIDLARLSSSPPPPSISSKADSPQDANDGTSYFNLNSKQTTKSSNEPSPPQSKTQSTEPDKLTFEKSRDSLPRLNIAALEAAGVRKPQSARRRGPSSLYTDSCSFDLSDEDEDDWIDEDTSKHDEDRVDLLHRSLLADYKDLAPKEIEIVQNPTADDEQDARDIRLAPQPLFWDQTARQSREEGSYSSSGLVGAPKPSLVRSTIGSLAANKQMASIAENEVEKSSHPALPRRSSQRNKYTRAVPSKRTSAVFVSRLSATSLPSPSTPKPVKRPTLKLQISAPMLLDESRIFNGQLSPIATHPAGQKISMPQSPTSSFPHKILKTFSTSNGSYHKQSSSPGRPSRSPSPDLGIAVPKRNKSTLNGKYSPKINTTFITSAIKSVRNSFSPHSRQASESSKYSTGGSISRWSKRESSPKIQRTDITRPVTNYELGANEGGTRSRIANLLPRRAFTQPGITDEERQNIFRRIADRRIALFEEKLRFRRRESMKKQIRKVGAVNPRAASYDIKPAIEGGWI